jgi:predicted HTH transcriptional regulator
MEDTGRLLSRLLAEDSESAWLEFKENLDDPEQIGQYVSALANGAALEGRANGYLVWGIEDSHHSIVGTRVDPPTLKVGNEDLEPWLVRLITPQVALRFVRVEATSSVVWLMQVGAASSRPVSFKGVEYIRVGSYKKPLRSHPEHERRLWRSFERESFESAGALDRLRDDEVLELIDYPGYFRLVGVPLPENRRGILEYLEHDEVIKRSTVGWAVSNLGAALFARDLGQFPSLARKTVRVVQYEGSNRVSAVREREGQLGYGLGSKA